MALNNPGNGDVPPTSLLRATLQPEATTNSPGNYAYDYTRNCYVRGDNSISVRDVCAALAERDALRKANTELMEALKRLLHPMADDSDIEHAQDLLAKLGEAA